MNVSELEGYALDAAVAEAQGLDWDMNLTLGGRTVLVAGMTRNYSPSTDWYYGGPIIEREKIDTVWIDGKWCAFYWPGQPADGGHYMDVYSSDAAGTGPTLLIAAMRAYVAYEGKP